MVDYQKLWIQLKEYINTKTGHGKNELLNKMTFLEIAQVNKIVKVEDDDE
jgi:hypothetical protein